MVWYTSNEKTRSSGRTINQSAWSLLSKRNGKGGYSADRLTQKAEPILRYVTVVVRCRVHLGKESDGLVLSRRCRFETSEGC